MTTVNKERVQLLVDALRSKEFEQCKQQLRAKEDDGRFTYCCLGVATEVALRHGFVFDHPTYGDAIWDQELGNMHGQTLLPEVRDWYGFESHSPQLMGKRPAKPGLFQAAAHHWNDTYDKNFDQIADMFEATYVTETTPAQ